MVCINAAPVNTPLDLGADRPIRDVTQGAATIAMACVHCTALNAGLENYVAWGLGTNACEPGYIATYPNGGAMVLVPTTNASAVPAISVLGTAFLLVGILTGGAVTALRRRRS